MQLKIRIVDAINLPCNNPIDPYCVLETNFNPDIFKTTTCQHTNSPNWNQDFVLNNIAPSGQIKVSIKSRNYIISKVIIPIQTIQPYKVIERWYDMQPEGNFRSGGKIRINFYISSIQNQQMNNGVYPQMIGNGMIPQYTYNSVMQVPMVQPTQSQSTRYRQPLSSHYSQPCMINYSQLAPTHVPNNYQPGFVQQNIQNIYKY